MTLLAWLRSKLALARGEVYPLEVAAEGMVRDDIRRYLRLTYPAVRLTDEGYVSSYVLPRGALSRIAEQAGCSRTYAGRVARDLGYKVEGRP